MKKRGYILAVTLCLAAAVVAAAAAVHFYNRSTALEASNAQYRRTIETANRRSFAQLAASLSSIDSNLKKLQYTTGGATFATITANIWRESEVAKQALAALPMADTRLDRLEKFIAQAGDYAFSLMRTAAGGAATGDEARESLRSLSAVAGQLAVQLEGLQERMDAADAYIQPDPGGLSMSQQPQGESVQGAFSQTEEEFPEYASLIYDGPFSEHVKSLKPKLLEGLTEVDEGTAMAAAQKFLGTEAALSPLHRGDGIIPYYCFAFGDTGTIEVSRRGGLVVSLTDSRELGQGRLSTEQALEAAAAFLAERGFEHMKTSYYTVYENILTINFAACQGDVILYPDLVKVGIALDNGTVVRFDASGYTMNHLERELEQPATTRDAAWAEVPQHLEVISENTALIPTSGKNEVLCYEFVCKDAEGRHVILYVNAATGAQENIFLLIEDENGVLTV